MVAQVIAVEPFDLVVFGATGDLAIRKLIPALYHRDADGQIPAEARIVGVSRRHLSSEAFREMAREAIGMHVGAADHDAAAIERFLARISYISVNATGEEGWSELAARFEGTTRILICYLSTGPDLFVPICERLGACGLASRARLVVEKPIGKNLESARAVNDAIGRHFPESHVYRIDHYLGKETVQNLMALRFANALFEPLWNAAHIDHVQITVAETLGVEGRAGYYDTAGALRDMVQNHILQLLCLVAMEPPPTLAADAVRDEKLKVLQALAPITQENVRDSAVRGQYRAGASAGKRLPSRVSEIVVAFRPIPHSVFDKSAGPVRSNRLVIRLQPDEGVKLWLMIKDPGPGGMRLRRVPLDMSFAETFAVRNPDAYERLLMDVVRGNQTLFMRRDEVEAAWTWVEPILQFWASTDDAPRAYTAGTWGPTASVAMIAKEGRTWHEEMV